jgi:maltose-binding protein MalE
MRIAGFLGIFIVLTQTLFALDIFVNDSFRKRYSNAELSPYLYTLPPTGDNSFHAENGTGISLDELFPPLIDAYRLDIISGEKKETILNPWLADELPHSYLHRGESGTWNCVLPNKTVPDVKALHIYGEEVNADQLDVWVSWEGTCELKEEIARYEKLHRITVNVTEVPTIDSKLVSISRGGGKLPDVVMVQSDYLPRLIAGDILQPIDYISKEHLLSKGVEAFILSQREWALPFYFDTQVVMINTGLVDTLPRPRWTLDELEQLCLGLKQRGISPISWNAYSAYWLIPFQMAFGKENIIENDGSLTIDDTATKKAIRYILSLREKGYLDIKERDGMTSFFISGDIGMILTGSYSIPYFEELGLDFAPAPYPVNGETGLPVSPLLDFKAFAVTRKTKRPVLAKRFLQYMSGIGVQQRFPARVAKLPAGKAAFALAEDTNPYFNTLKRSEEIGTVIPPGPAYKIYKNTMWKLLRFIFSEQMTVEETLKQGQAIIEEKLEYSGSTGTFR